MPSTSLPKKRRRVVALAIWLTLAGMLMKLAACSGLNPNPPDPHEALDGDPPSDGGAPDAGDASDGSP